MAVELHRAGKADIETIWRMQLEAFAGLLEKYRDYETSPGAEPVEKIEARMLQPYTYYYFIQAEGKTVGVIRVVDRKEEGVRKRVSPLFIMPEYRGKGYAQQAMLLAEEIHGSDGWALDTILQEPGNLHLYEKMGYRQTGVTKEINGRMTLVFYEKN